MTPAQFQAIKKRNAERTQGKWVTGIREGTLPIVCVVVDDNDEYIIVEASYSDFSTDQDTENCLFIAHASEDIPVLLAEIERLEKAVKVAYNDGFKTGYNQGRSNAEEGRY